MLESDLRQLIAEIAKLDVSLDKKGGPGKSGKLFETILAKQGEVLDEFSLPHTPYYQHLLSFDSIPWDNEVDELIKLLHNEARKQKDKSPKTELEILIDAQKTNRDPMFILPQLKIKTHVYTLYVYNNILMYLQNTPENILSELKLVNNGDTLDIIGKMTYSTDWLGNPEESILSLENKGLKYVRKYFMAIINDLKKMGFTVNGF
jgi:hypothetical protein